jgi:hypothetical protein
MNYQSILFLYRLILKYIGINLYQRVKDPMLEKCLKITLDKNVLRRNESYKVS